MLNAVDDASYTTMIAGGASALTAVISALVAAYVTKKKWEIRGRKQSNEEDATALEEWKKYAEVLKQDIERNKQQAQAELVMAHTAINKLTRRADRSDRRERKCQQRLAILEERLGIKASESDDDTPNTDTDE